FCARNSGSRIIFFTIIYSLLSRYISTIYVSISTLINKISFFIFSLSSICILILMIPYKQLSLADIFLDCHEKFENDKPAFLSNKLS
ncbi:hypothetical protein DW951_15270, partial [Agathobacter rectalis]